MEQIQMEEKKRKYQEQSQVNRHRHHVVSSMITILRKPRGRRVGLGLSFIRYDAFIDVCRFLFLSFIPFFFFLLSYHIFLALFLKGVEAFRVVLVGGRQRLFARRCRYHPLAGSKTLDSVTLLETINKSSTLSHH